MLTDEVQRCCDQHRKPTYIYFVVVVGDSLDVAMVIFVKASISCDGLFLTKDTFILGFLS